MRVAEGQIRIGHFHLLGVHSEEAPNRQYDAHPAVFPDQEVVNGADFLVMVALDRRANEFARTGLAHLGHH